jgi:xylulokinase
MTISNATPANLARASVEGILCGMADALDALRDNGARVQRVCLVGGAAASAAVQEIASAVFGLPVEVPPNGEYVADGAARQAAWVLTGTMPDWPLDSTSTVIESASTSWVRERYLQARDHWLVAQQ